MLLPTAESFFLSFEACLSAVVLIQQSVTIQIALCHYPYFASSPSLNSFFSALYVWLSHCSSRRGAQAVQEEPSVWIQCQAQ